MSIYTRKEMAMLYDASKCTGCKGCQVACKQWNVLYSDLGMNAFPFSGSYQNPQDLNGSNRLVMTFKEKKSDNQLRPVEWLSDAVPASTAPTPAALRSARRVV